MVLISLNIDEDVQKKVKVLELKHKMVYMRGFQDIINKNSYEDAIEQWRKKMERMSHLLDHYIARSVKLEDELEELKKCGLGNKNVTVKKKLMN